MRLPVELAVSIEVTLLCCLKRQLAAVHAVYSSLCRGVMSRSNSRPGVSFTRPGRFT